MSFTSVHLGRPTDHAIARLLALAEESELTYDHLRSTIEPAAGRVLTRHDLLLGSGEACFRRAVQRLHTWGCHHAIGAEVFPIATPLREGATVIVALPVGPLSILVPNRIVAVIDEPKRFGFAYGSLEGHHERGEESFIAEHHDDDTVRATITIDATEASIAARLAAPFVRAFQGRAARGYLRGLAD